MPLNIFSHSTYCHGHAQLSSWPALLLRVLYYCRKILSRALLCLLASEAQEAEAKDGIAYKTHVTASDKLSTVFLDRDSCRAAYSSYHHTVISCEIFTTHAAWRGSVQEKSFQEILEDIKYRLTQVPCTGKHPFHWP